MSGNVFQPLNPARPFTGTAYLGIPTHAEFRQHLCEGLARWGTHYGGSRHSNAAPTIYGEAENQLAAQVGAASALLFSSGTLAGQILLKILETEAEIHLAPGAHPALWAREGPSSSSFSEWTIEMRALCTSPGPPVALLGNSVDPLGVHIFDFSFLSKIQIRRKVILVVDDSHGFYLLGENGKGVFPDIASIQGIEAVVLSSLGKAAGIPAGVVLGPAYWTEMLRESAFFGGASPAPPAYLYAFTQSTALYQARREYLKNLLHSFTAALPPASGLHFIPGFPVFRIQQNAIADALRKAGIEFASFSYPTPMDPPISRIVVNAGHHKEDLEAVLAVIRDCQSI